MDPSVITNQPIFRNSDNVAHNEPDKVVLKVRYVLFSRLFTNGVIFLLFIATKIGLCNQSLY